MNTAIISIACTVVGILVTFIFSYIGFRRSTKKDSQDEGKNEGVILSDIGYIKAGVDDLKRENRETRTAINLLSERVTRCEESGKQAHHRIDEIIKGEIPVNKGR